MNTDRKSVAILNTKAPFASSDAKEAMDVALIYGSYEQPTHLFFQGDGIFQLIDSQQPDIINVKNFLKTFSAFEFYDLENIYVCHQSLKARNINLGFHIDNVQVLDSLAFSDKLHQHSVILTF